MNWIHIVADFHQVDFDFWIWKLDTHIIVDHINELLIKYWFNVLWKQHHVFGDQAFSVVYLLSESHVSLHTWPEHKYVSFDIFVCNNLNDNSKNAKLFFDEIVKLINAQKVDYKIIDRH